MVNGEMGQYKKGTMKEYFRIMSTVLEIMRDFIKRHKDVFVVMFEEPVTGERIGQKMKYYLQVANQNIPSTMMIKNVKSNVPGRTGEGIIIGPIRK